MLAIADALWCTVAMSRSTVETETQVLYAWETELKVRMSGHRSLEIFETSSS
jgi:hypothetical protein